MNVKVMIKNLCLFLLMKGLMQKKDFTAILNFSEDQFKNYLKAHYQFERSDI